MWTKAVGLSVALVFLSTLQLASGQSSGVQLSAVNSTGDFDFSGEIVYAVNFGNSGNPTIGQVVFSQDEDYPGQVSLSCSQEVPAVPSDYGVNPSTDDSNLDLLLGSVAWTNDGYGRAATHIALNGLQPGIDYKLQLVFYEARANQNRHYEIAVADEVIVEMYDVLANQGGVLGKGGSVLKYAFTATESSLDIEITPVPNDGNWLSSISALVLTEVPSRRFADYGSGTTLELISGKGLWKIDWGQIPWTWSDGTDQPLLGSNVSGLLDILTTAPADLSEDVVATLPIAGTLTLSAHDELNNDEVIGEIVLSGAGFNIVDLNAQRVTVDEGAGMILAPFYPPGPEMTFTLDEATGVFAYISQTGDWRPQLAGLYALPRMQGFEVQENIMKGLGGAVPLIGGLGAFALSGQYVPDESKRAEYFCEYGTGIALQLGPGQGVWDQIWGGEAPTWHTCEAASNVRFLGENVVALLETADAGPTSVSDDMIVRFTYGGQITITKRAEAGSDEVVGRIVGDMDGLLVADLSAERATFDDDGNIVVVMGTTLHDRPDVEIEVVEQTGVYADIRQAGDWHLYMHAEVTIARDPDMPLQQNIMAGLGNPDLLLGASEELVLTGWYYREQ